MTLIHHPVLKVDADVPEEQAPLFCDPDGPGWLVGAGPWAVDIDPGFPPPGFDHEAAARTAAELTEAAAATQTEGAKPTET